EREVRIDFPAPARLPHALLRLNHADCGYASAPAAPTVILHDANFGLEAGDRIGLLGPNGAGKSTLVKSLVGDLPLLTGERYAHPDLRIGYFAQHTVESLVAGTSPIDHLREISPNASTQDFRNFLGKWSFPGDRAFESIDGFSGGERARLALALIAWRQPNVLLLDEPTNHLDLEMREALAEALADFAGAIVLVSHDRHLIGLVSETYWRVSEGVVRPFDGDLDDYATWLRSRPQDAKSAGAAPGAAMAAVEPPPPPAPKAARSNVNPNERAQSEAGGAGLEWGIADIDARLAGPAFHDGPDAATRASDAAQRRAALVSELAEAERVLLALYDAS